MRIIWHGHSCFEVKDGATVVTDPHDGKSIGIKTPVVKADIVLVSHEHFDHNCTRIVKGDFHIIREPGERWDKGVHIFGLSAFHDAEGGARRGRDILFRFIMDDITFLHCGDLGHILTQEQVDKLGPIDVLFVPVGGVFTIDADAAIKLIEMVRPKVAVPMHFRIGGLSISVHTVDEFVNRLPEDKVIRVGNEVEFLQEELPQETEYWLFSL
ncbi:MAG: metal-dependent hydrolase [Methanomassiliicoccales archaeon PtaU1.Bin124]|nr:MAG: metal-dependent hydrolase [Methanomassiliicoccales archaeon PtaU1.Bin124]